MAELPVVGRFKVAQKPASVCCLFQCFVCSRLNGCSRSFVGSAVVNVVVVAVVDVVVATVDVVTIAVVVVVAVAAVNTLK